MKSGKPTRSGDLGSPWFSSGQQTADQFSTRAGILVDGIRTPCEGEPPPAAMGNRYRRYEDMPHP